MFSNKTRLCLSIACFLLFAMTSFAQGLYVKGTVTDSAGEPLPGAVVRVRGTSNATVTTLEGKFELENVARGGNLKYRS